MFRVSTALIIRSTKNCNRSLRYRSYYRYSYFHPTWRGPDLATLGGSSCSNQPTNPTQPTNPSDQPTNRPTHVTLICVYVWQRTWGDLALSCIDVWLKVLKNTMIDRMIWGQMGTRNSRKRDFYYVLLLLLLFVVVVVVVLTMNTGSFPG